MKKNASYNTETKKSTFGQTISKGEVKFGTEVNNDSPGAYGLKLAGEKGTTGAKSLLRSRYSKG